jgi:hypothetical protein
LDLRRRKWWEAREDCIMRSFITCKLCEYHSFILSLAPQPSSGRRIRWTGHVVRMGEVRNKIFWLENLVGIDNSEDLVIDGRILE